MLVALLVTLATPATWALALATFLIRGGIVVVLLPIVVLPTTVGLGNVFGPILRSVAFGSIPIEIIAGAALVGTATVAWLLGGGWLAAASEAHGAWIVERQPDVTATVGGPVPVGPTLASGPEMTIPRQTGSVAARILTARLIAAIPFGVVLAVGSIRLIFVAYRELTAPVDVATPIVVRVLRGSPEVVVGVVLAWMATEVVGAVAARRIAMTDTRIGRALRCGVSALVREPVASLSRFWLPTLVLIGIAVPAAVAAGSSWDAVGSSLGRHGDPIQSFLAVVVFVGLWVVGLTLIGVVCAWRAAVWTLAEVSHKGTFGGSADRRPGH